MLPTTDGRLAGRQQADIREQLIPYANCATGPVRARLTCATVLVKKYTEDHEWIEMDDAGKIGMP